MVVISNRKKNIRICVFALILFSGIFAAGERSAACQQPEFADLIKKIRHGRHKVSFTGEVLVERNFRGQQRTFMKRVINRLPDDFREELILTPEERKHLEKKRRGNRGKNKEGQRGRMRHWDDNFQRRHRPDMPFTVHTSNVELLKKNYKII